MHITVFLANACIWPSPRGALRGVALAIVWICLVLGVFAPGSSAALTVNCTGNYSPTDARVAVVYQHDTRTCTISNSETMPTVDGNIKLVLLNAGIHVDLRFTPIIGTSVSTAFTSCHLNGFARATGSTCTAALSFTTATADMDFTNQAGDTIKMELSVTIDGSNARTINSASVTTSAGPLSSGSASAPQTTQPTQAVVASVARSQSKLVTDTIQQHVDSLGGGFGAAVLSSPSGAGTDTGGTAIPGDGNTGSTTSDDTRQQNLVGGSQFLIPGWAPASVAETLEQKQRQSRGGSMRDLAMMARFDSRNMVLSATGTDGSDTGNGVDARSRLSAPRNVTVWGRGAYTDVDNDYNRANADNRYDGDVWNYNLGADYRFNDRVYGGVAVGFSETDLTTHYNSGTYEETAWTITPYAVMRPRDDLQIALMAGYGQGKLDLTRGSGAVSADTDTESLFGSASATYAFKPSEANPLTLSAKARMLAAYKSITGYSESDGSRVTKTSSTTIQLRPGVEAAYDIRVGSSVLQPFVSSDFVYDLSDTTNDDRTAVELGGGMRIANANGLSGSLQAETELGRTEYARHTISGLIAYSFAVGDALPFGSSLMPYMGADHNAYSRSFRSGINLTNEEGDANLNLQLRHFPPEDSIQAVTDAMTTLTIKF